ncbi:MAG: hypothetical protein ABI197_05825 [Granulicella sp.]
MGEVLPPRIFFGSIMGRFVKFHALRDDDPMIRNSRTVPGFAITDDRNLTSERQGSTGLSTARQQTDRRSVRIIRRFFGNLTHEQWGILMYKHLDHHLRQFGV